MRNKEEQISEGYHSTWQPKPGWYNQQSHDWLYAKSLIITGKLTQLIKSAPSTLFQSDFGYSKGSVFRSSLHPANGHEVVWPGPSAR